MLVLKAAALGHHHVHLRAEPTAPLPVKAAARIRLAARVSAADTGHTLDKSVQWSFGRRLSLGSPGSDLTFPLTYPQGTDEWPCPSGVLCREPFRSSWPAQGLRTVQSSDFFFFFNKTVKQNCSGPCLLLFKYVYIFNLVSWLCRVLVVALGILGLCCSAWDL